MHIRGFGIGLVVAGALGGVFGYVGGRDAQAATDRALLKSEQAVLDELREQSAQLQMQQVAIGEISARVRSISSEPAISPTRDGSTVARTDEADEQAPVEPSRPATVAEAPDPEAKVAHEEALAMVQRAISRGTWQARDRTELSKRWAQLTQEQSTDILTRLSTALGAGKVSLEHGAPTL